MPISRTSPQRAKGEIESKFDKNVHPTTKKG